MEEYNLSIGELIAKGREDKGLSKRELSRIAGISDTELNRIESGERELPNPKILRKISQHIGINYSDLMYAAGLGLQVTTLNPFLRHYYAGLKGDKIDEALVNTLGSIDNSEALIKEYKERLEDKNVTESEKELLLQAIEDTEYQVNSAQEVVKLLHSAKTKERIQNERKN
ncbi:MAG: helix-turn-helix transcriptional regulator [Bacilli bacterium]|nr:helix-turn-helix transcriptional regulator [Bacilli bacterium]